MAFDANKNYQAEINKAHAEGRDASQLIKERQEKINSNRSAYSQYEGTQSQNQVKNNEINKKKTTNIPGMKPVTVSGTGNPNGRTLYTLEDATTDAERSIFLGAQGILQDGKQYAYKDEYGFEHVGDLAQALTYGNNSAREYTGAARGGYARDANGNRAMIGLDGSRNYGNAPVDRDGNPVRYAADGTLSDKSVDLDSYLNGFRSVMDINAELAAAAPVIKPVYSGPGTTGKDKHGDVDLDHRGKPTKLDLGNPAYPRSVVKTIAPAPIGGGMEPKSGPSYTGPNWNAEKQIENKAILNPAANIPNSTLWELAKSGNSTTANQAINELKRRGLYRD